MKPYEWAMGRRAGYFHYGGSSWEAEVARDKQCAYCGKPATSYVIFRNDAGEFVADKGAWAYTCDDHLLEKQPLAMLNLLVNE